MFELVVNGHFDAAHFLKGYQGKCAQIHGHTWKVEVKVRGSQLDQVGMLLDFSLLKARLKEITKKLDHTLINETSEFLHSNPTAENISKYIYDQFHQFTQKYGVRVYSVTIWESPNAAATYLSE